MLVLNIHLVQRKLLKFLSFFLQRLFTHLFLTLENLLRILREIGPTDLFCEFFLLPRDKLKINRWKVNCARKNHLIIPFICWLTNKTSNTPISLRLMNLEKKRPAPTVYLLTKRIEEENRREKLNKTLKPFFRATPIN